MFSRDKAAKMMQRIQWTAAVHYSTNTNFRMGDIKKGLSKGIRRSKPTFLEPRKQGKNANKNKRPMDLDDLLELSTQECFEKF